MRHCLLTLLILFSSGCVDWHYAHTPVGELDGKLIVQWISPDPGTVFTPEPFVPPKGITVAA